MPTELLSTSDLGQLLTFWMGCFLAGYGPGFVMRWFQGISEKL